jgi:hypothetical protein
VNAWADNTVSQLVHHAHAHVPSTSEKKGQMAGLPAEHPSQWCAQHSHDALELLRPLSVHAPRCVTYRSSGLMFLNSPPSSFNCSTLTRRIVTHARQGRRDLHGTRGGRRSRSRAAVRVSSRAAADGKRYRQVQQGDVQVAKRAKQMQTQAVTRRASMGRARAASPHPRRQQSLASAGPALQSRRSKGVSARAAAAREASHAPCRPRPA